MRFELSLRSRFMLIVLGGALLPLALIGLWLMRSVERSGEELLRARMDVSMQRLVEDVGARWLPLRATLLDLAEDAHVQASYRADRPPDSTLIRTLRDGHVGTGTALRLASFRTLDGTERWVLTPRSPGTGPSEPQRSAAPVVDRPVLQLTLPVLDNASGSRLGSLDAVVDIRTLVPTDELAAVTAGSVLAMFDRDTRAPLLPLAFDPALLERDRFRWGGEDWITLRQRLEAPPVELVLAAPLTPYRQPFEQAAQKGILAFLLVGLLAFATVSLLTRRLTGSLEHLAHAAEAVAQGELDRSIEERGTGEVARVASAFNTMTASLNATLGKLAQREGLAALGEFAATLAHEIRNPLSSIRIDLQRAQEKARTGSDVQPVINRALGDVQRLDGTVSNVLRFARSGRIRTGPIDLRQPALAAARTAQPQLDRQRVRLDADLETPLPVDGDAAALEQLFLNLILNAVDALDDGGHVTVTGGTDGEWATITIRDHGRGIPPEAIARIFEPFFSTTPEGTGLGLPIARRIADAHGGRLEVDSEPGRGTSARVCIRFRSQS